MTPTFGSICSLISFWTILNILLTCLNIGSISSFYVLNQYLNLFWTFLRVLVCSSIMFNFKVQVRFSLFSHLFHYLFKIPLLSRLIRFNFADFYLTSYIFYSYFNDSEVTFYILHPKRILPIGFFAFDEPL